MTMIPSLVPILHLPELRFASQLLLETPVIAFAKQNKLNTDKKLDFCTGRVFVEYDKFENTQLSILIKYILNSSESNQFREQTIQGVIVLVISNQLRASRSSDFELTHAITP